MSDSHVIGGHKANLNNPNTSAASKAHSSAVLADMGAAAGTPISSSGDDGKDTKHVAAGLKGALHNANVSTAAKVDAAGKLRDMGELAK